MDFQTNGHCPNRRGSVPWRAKMWLAIGAWLGHVGVNGCKVGTSGCKGQSMQEALGMIIKHANML